jgi:predicted restriction endonuclease
MELRRILTDKKWQQILDSIQTGGNNWHSFQNSKDGGCLLSCPGYSNCHYYGPENVCSSNWRDAPASQEIFSVLFHIFDNFDYYNRKDLRNYNRDSKTIKEIRQFLFDARENRHEDDEVGLGIEDLINLKLHKQYERNEKLAMDAKKTHGWKCQACGFDFQERYGEIGENYIEAHHLLPLSTLKGKRVTLDPKVHFCVLCANCHRMIHRSGHVNDLMAFRETHIKL